MSTNSEKKKIKTLIRAVRKHPYLYDTNDKQYRNYPVKNTAWGQIAERVGIEGKCKIVLKLSYCLVGYFLKIATSMYLQSLWWCCYLIIYQFHPYSFLWCCYFIVYQFLQCSKTF